MKTNLDIVKACDNFPYHELGDNEAYEQRLASLWTFFLPDDSRPHGFLLDPVVKKIPWTEDFRIISSPRKEVHLLQKDGRSIERLLAVTREKGVFSKLGEKRNEVFPIVGAKFPIGIERSASSLFGIIGRGVHMTVYTQTKTGLKFWVAQRNLNKSTYPGMLDNTVAGGVSFGELPFECLVRETVEEAAMLEDLVREKALAAGTVTWFNIGDQRAGGEPGLMNPGLLYVYDLEIGPEVVLKPLDNDVYAFHLMNVLQVKEAMSSGHFKPASANVMMDFFVRHAIITAEDDADYADIVSRLHRKLPFAMSPTG